MAYLHRNRQASFSSLRSALDLTSGNVATHTSRLEEAGYISSGRVLAGNTFEKRYRITEAGARAFEEYVEALRDVLPVDEG